MLYNSLTTPPRIVNDILATSEKEKESLDQLIYTVYSGDVLSNLPSCMCGKTTGGYKEDPNVVCSHCGTHVVLQVERNLEPILWMRSPQGVAPLMNPLAWGMLQRRFNRSKFDMMRWLTDRDYVPKVAVPQLALRLESEGVQRGYNFFVYNFDMIMEKLFSLSLYRKRGPMGDPLEIYVQKFRDRLFNNFLPIPNRALLVVEESATAKFVEPVTPKIINAVRHIAGIDTGLKRMDQRVRENRTAKTMMLLSEFYQEYIRTVLTGKKGAYRKHVYGTSCHWSFRAVITSNTRAHRQTDLELPWSIATTVFATHLHSKLYRRGWSMRDAMAYIDAHAHKYSALLDEVFQELIAECPYEGIPVTIVRYPSLGRGSIQLMFLRRVKTDPEDNTIGYPITSTKAPNAKLIGHSSSNARAVFL